MLANIKPLPEKCLPFEKATLDPNTIIACKKNCLQPKTEIDTSRNRMKAQRPLPLLPCMHLSIQRRKMALKSYVTLWSDLH
jgi:hypothetical protein